MAEQIELQIRKYRKARGLSLADLALEIGTTAQTISRLERSKMKLSVEWIDQLAEVLDVSPYLLLGAPLRPEITTLGTLNAAPRSPAAPAPVGGLLSMRCYAARLSLSRHLRLLH